MTLHAAIVRLAILIGGGALYLSMAASPLSPIAPSARLTSDTRADKAVAAVSKRCERKAVNAVAKDLARTAELTAEAIATENEGAYTRVSPATLHAEEPDVAITPREGRQWRGAYVLSASGTADSYVATVRASNGNTFTVRRTAAGEIVRTARVCGAKRHW